MEAKKLSEDFEELGLKNMKEYHRYSKKGKTRVFYSFSLPAEYNWENLKKQMESVVADSEAFEALDSGHICIRIKITDS